MVSKTWVRLNESSSVLAGAASSHPANSFTPISPDGPLISATSDLHSSEDRVCAETSDTGFDSNGNADSQSSQGARQMNWTTKRKLHTNARHDAVKQPRQQLPVPAQNPFETMRVTKLTRSLTKTEKSDQHIPYITIRSPAGDPRHRIQKTTMDCMTSHSQPSTAAYLSAPAALEHFKDGKFPLQELHTPKTCLLYLATREPLFDHTRAPVDQEDEITHPSSHTLDGLEDDVGGAHSFDQSDDYGFDSSLECSMLHMADAVYTVLQDHFPPSSMLENLDRDSRSAEEYDRKPQHSPRPISPFNSGTQPIAPIEGQSLTGDDDFLDEDVDWDAVHTVTNALPKESSSADTREVTSRLSSEDSPSSEKVPQPPDENSIVSDLFAPFVRPPFPEKVRDKTSVPGTSSRTILRTCFRIGHLVNQATHCCQDHQDAVFELYARVTYSSRESLARKQHFQFVDLYKDQQPYPSGSLVGWRVGSLLDRQSQTFVNINAPKLCWCMCKLVRNQRASTGWFIEVLGVRETTWEQIQYAKMILCGAENVRGASEETSTI